MISDAFTSVLAIASLFLGKYFGLNKADPLMGVLGGLVILKWSIGLCKSTVWELLDGNSKIIQKEKLKQLFEKYPDVEVLDLHVWRIAPNAHACELMVKTKERKGSDFYRQLILQHFTIEHILIEELV